jgi:hypothetical protein
MAIGDVLLDADGNVVLNDAGEVVLTDCEELAIQARACSTGDLADLWYELGGWVNVSPNDNTSPTVQNVLLGEAEAVFTDGRLYFFFGGADSGTCYYFDVADQAPFTSASPLAHWMNIGNWPWDYTRNTIPTIYLINQGDTCTSAWGFRDTWPCDKDDDGFTDDPPPGVEIIPDDPDDPDHPPGIDNGNCTGQHFYNTLLVFFRGVTDAPGGNSCIFIDLRRQDFETAGIDDGFVVRYTGTGVSGALFYEGARAVRYRYCTPFGGDCIDCVPSDTTWAQGWMKVFVEVDFTDAVPIGWRVSAELWLEGGEGFFGDYFSGTSPPLGDCDGVEGLPNDYTDGSDIQIAAGGWADIFNANSA